LTTLKLGSLDLTDEDALLLAGSPHLGNVVELNLEANYLASAGVLALLESTNLRSLRRLVLSVNPLGEAGIAALARCPGLVRLQILDLLYTTPDQVHVTADQGALALADSPYLEQMEILRLRDNLSRTTRARLRERLGERLELV
jgi:hypothetical protein